METVESAPGGVGLVARGITLRRGGRLVLRDAAIDVPRGQVTVLVAPSGAGKSTLLRCLTRLLEPEAGTIALAGVPVAALPPRQLRRRVGLVAQRPVMLPGSVADNVTYALPAAGEATVPDALRAAGLDPAFAARAAGELSGGEQARVALARALARHPEILLLDEPTAALDAEVADRVGATLRALATAGLGVCVATHDLRFAATIADRTVHLDPPQSA